MTDNDQQPGAVDVAAIQKRLGLVPAGPWHAGRTVGRTVYMGDGPDDLIGIMDTGEMADFVAHAREDLPALADALQRAEFDRDMWKGLLDDKTEQANQLAADLQRAEQRVAALEQLSTAQDRLLAAHRLQDHRRGAKAADDVRQARDALQALAQPEQPEQQRSICEDCGGAGHLECDYDPPEGRAFLRPTPAAQAREGD